MRLLSGAGQELPCTGGFSTPMDTFRVSGGSFDLRVHWDLPLPGGSCIPVSFSLSRERGTVFEQDFSSGAVPEPGVAHTGVIWIFIHTCLCVLMNSWCAHTWGCSWLLSQPKEETPNPASVLGD